MTVHFELIFKRKPDLLIACSTDKLDESFHHNAIVFNWPNTLLRVSWGNGMLISNLGDKKGFELWKLTKADEAIVYEAYVNSDEAGKIVYLPFPQEKTFGQLIKTARERLGINQAKLSKHVFGNKSGAAIATLENDSRVSLYDEHIKLLASMLRLPYVTLKKAWKEHSRNYNSHFFRHNDYSIIELYEELNHQ